MEIQDYLVGDTDFNFLISIVVRTAVMFLVILVFLKILGKRGVKQLSVFELVVILGLGSAAGDPMIYDEVGLLSAFTAFTVVAVCYKLVTLLVFKIKWLENFVEGKGVYIIKKGKFSIDEFQKETLSKDEFFMELRVRGVFHLGQVEYAILETTGEISVYFFDPRYTKYGLPILPGSLNKIVNVFNVDTFYSCTFCGQTVKYLIVNTFVCPNCHKTEWVKASNRKISK